MIEQNAKKIEELINHYNLLPHPEGGFFRQTYAAAEQISKEALPERFEEIRSFSTAIYFLLPYGSFSAFHRIKSDEVWHFYEGRPLNIHVIHPNSDYECLKLGSNLKNGESYQLVVPANAWFASEPIGDNGSFALVGCTVAPGFDFADFELADAEKLVEQFPIHEQLIGVFPVKHIGILVLKIPTFYRQLSMLKASKFQTKPYKMNSLFKSCKVFLFFILIQQTATAQTDHIGEIKTLQAHPRILMLKGEEANIQLSINKDTVWANTQQAIINESDRLLSIAPVQRIQIGRRLLDKSREALRRLFFLSYAYRTTADKKYLDRAEKEMLAIAGFSDWNPSHFLDVAEMTMAVAIGYDWLYNDLSDASKSIIKEAILKKGLEPSMESKYNGWLKAEHNWNQVCNAGMTYGAMAIYEDQPVLAKEIINRAIGSIVLPMHDYGPDGVYPEGYGYWGYGTSFNVMFISAIEKLFGKDFGLNQLPGFMKTAGFMENMTGPTGKPFNYSDAGGGGGLHPAMFWLANKVNDPSLLWVERNYLKTRKPEALVLDRLFPAIMLWSGGISIDNISAPTETMWLGNGKNPVAMMRTSWTDPNAIYVATKGGSVSINHAHMDIGSFVMEADGVRWAMDFGMQDYESLESKGIKLFGRTQDAERWTVFRLTNLVHNTLAIDSQHQLVTGNAPIIASSKNPDFMHTIVDLSEIYKGQVAASKRGIAVVDKKQVLIRDEIETLGKETTIRWTMLTPAEVTIINDHQALLTKDGKTLTLDVGKLPNLKMKTWSTDPPKSYDAPNPGTILTGFEVTVPANTKIALNVRLIPGKKVKSNQKNIPALENWKN